ncbi:acyltransferase family protein [Duganella sp. BuS-21]|uniref:acyltransferase family protein n=1 Tax=Duganella sp. BuS-21 TaxID=2943848 RepID=UPI0035A6A498
MKSLNLPYNPRIDQLRWLAATLVFLFHAYLEYRGHGGVPVEHLWLGLITEGHTGVGLFFTLSGFLFMRIALHQGPLAYGEFLRNRILRIFPLYFTVFLLATSIGRDKFVPQDILYLLVSNLGMAPTSSNPITGAAWCISLEFLFYMVFPFLARFAIERGPRYLVSLLALMAFFKLASFAVNPNSTLMYFSTFVGRFDQFLIGMLAGLLFQQAGPALRRHAGWLLPLALLLVVGNSALQAHVARFNAVPHSTFWIYWSMLESAGWAVLIVAWVAWERKLPDWLERLLCHGGKISFSFYLLHMMVINMVGQLQPTLPVITGHVRIDAGLATLIVYGLVWGLATLSYATIEEPFLRLRRNYGADRKGDAV